MKKIKKLLFYLALAVCIISVPNTALETHAASKVKLNKKSVTLTKGTYVNLKVSGTKKAVKWSSKNKKIATVNKNGKVSAKKAGQTKIIAKVGSKKFVCTVNVVKQNTDIDNLNAEMEKNESNLCEHGYNSSSIKIQDATCETAGSVLVYCKICNKTLLEIPIEPKGHKISIRGQKEPTYDLEGYTGDKYCEVCGKIIEKGTTIPKKEYIIVNLTPENFNQYFEETTVFGKYVDSSGDTYIYYDHCYILNTEWRNKNIKRIMLGPVKFEGKYYTGEFEVNPETLTSTVIPSGGVGNKCSVDSRMDLAHIYVDNGICYFIPNPNFTGDDIPYGDKKRVPSVCLDTGSIKIDGKSSDAITFSRTICSDIDIKSCEGCAIYFSK